MAEGISDAELEAMLRVGAMDQDQALLARRLAQVDALRAQPDPHHTAIGGGLGAAAQVLNGYTANRNEGAAYQQAAAMRQAQIDAMRTMIQARTGGPQQDPGSMQAPQPM